MMQINSKFLAPLPGIDSLFLKCEVNRDSAKFDLIHAINWQISTCMQKDRYAVFQLDPEIERTVRRLRREQRNSKTTSGMNNLQEEGNLNPHGPLQLVNIQEEQNEHANERQPSNNNIIYMADYAVLTPQVVHPGSLDLR